MNDVRVSSWNELNECLYEESWRPELGRFRAHFAYRGMSSASYDLRTSLTRLGGKKVEDAILRAFRKYARQTDFPGDSIWNWLALAQHHQLPTRLLDWTYSPYVAGHFATEKLHRYDVDGVIWMVDFRKTNAYLPLGLKAILEEEDSDVFTTESLSRAATTFDGFDSLGDDSFVVFLEPPSLDERIVNQYALFSLLSHPTSSLDCWLEQHPDTSRRIIIPAELKWEIRDKLDQANITERVLYPGLDGLSRWLRRYYTPRDVPHGEDD